MNPKAEYAKSDVPGGSPPSSSAAVALGAGRRILNAAARADVLLMGVACSETRGAARAAPAAPEMPSDGRATETWKAAVAATNERKMRPRPIVRRRGQTVRREATQRSGPDSRCDGPRFGFRLMEQTDGQE